MNFFSEADFFQGDVNRRDYFSNIPEITGDGEYQLSELLGF
jgi:hypothetical protein